jgi:hypothetical protein
MQADQPVQINVNLNNDFRALSLDNFSFEHVLDSIRGLYSLGPVQLRLGVQCGENEWVGNFNLSQEAHC